MFRNDKIIKKKKNPFFVFLIFFYCTAVMDIIVTRDLLLWGVLFDVFVFIMSKKLRSGIFWKKKPTRIGKTISLHLKYIRIENARLPKIYSKISKILHKYDMRDLCVYPIILVNYDCYLFLLFRFALVTIRTRFVKYNARKAIWIEDDYFSRRPWRLPEEDFE